MASLPSLPHELLRLAVDDLERCEEDPFYQINMMQYHYPRNDRCEVCLAGSVIAKTLGKSPLLNSLPSDFDRDTCQKLVILDACRAGNWEMVLGGFGIKDPFLFYELRQQVGIPWPYQNNPRHFKQKLLKAAEIFERWFITKFYPVSSIILFTSQKGISQ